VLAATGLAPAAPTLAAGQASAASSEYGFAPGLIYLNTASLGPTPRSIRDAMDAAWTELETNPVRMAYGDGGVLAETDLARARVGAFLGCGSDELLLTRSTTDAMNVVAAGTRLSEGDRVLTTDQEHEGGTYCWTSLGRVGHDSTIPEHRRFPARIRHREGKRSARRLCVGFLAVPEGVKSTEAV
jgi:selenocysteine lyase/cysteine desulfurase